MSFAFNKQHPEWTIQQQLWLLAQVEEGRTQQEIYADLNNEDDPSVRPEQVEWWDGSFAAFKKRLRRLTKNGIDPAIDTETGQKLDVDLGTPRGRYEYWLWVAKTTTDRTSRGQALQMIEKLAPQFEENPDKLTLAKFRANPHKNIDLDDADLWSEVIADQIRLVVVEGDEEWLTEHLRVWLECCSKRIITTIIRQIVKSHKIELGDETREERLLRLVGELKMLPEDDLAELYRIGEEGGSLEDDDDED